MFTELKSICKSDPEQTQGEPHTEFISVFVTNHTRANIVLYFQPAPPKTETATPPETPAENGNKESSEQTDKPDNNDQKEKTTETNQQESEPAQMEVD